MTATQKISVKELNQLIQTLEGPVIVDVRRKKAFDESDKMIATAEWRDPDQAANWADELPKDAAVVVYCVHGHDVSQGAAAALRQAGVDALFLEGGIEDFVKAGGKTVAK
ncbi:MAG: rhodanese-like domain-containing protein [Proteobacteria bacterium]|nr:rhodanese-like domain-containing protein [Pseudomonadota bacterium]MDA1023463.1 rhodanese-like domain-containing protein [Pseudomonadota bacterium]